MTLDLAAAALAASLAVPVTAPPVAVPTPSGQAAAEKPAAPASVTPISVHVYLGGTASLFCTEPPPPHGGSGHMSGWARLSAWVPVRGPNGESGSVEVSGSTFLSGTCHFGSGTVMGSAPVRGGGTIHGPGGKRARVELSGHAFISKFASGGTVFLSEPVTLTGTVTAE